MPLSENLKFWLYSSIKKFFSLDPYLKNFKTEEILSEFKYFLSESSTSDELLEQLDKCSQYRAMRFYRKQGAEESHLYFVYPRLSFQIESILVAWKDILSLEKEIINNYELEYISEYSQFPTVESEDEGACSRQFVFGLRPNTNTFYNSSAKLDFSLRDYEMSKITPLQANFKTEYSYYKISVKNQVSKVALKEEKKCLFFQTDIRSFYHSLPIDEIQQFFRKYHGI